MKKISSIYLALLILIPSIAFAGKDTASVEVRVTALEGKVSSLQNTVTSLQNAVADLQNQINIQQLAILGLEQNVSNMRVGYNDNSAGMLIVNLTGSYKNIISVTLNAPSNGYIVVTGSGYTGITHSYGKTDTVRVSLPNWTDGFHSAAFTTASVPSTAPSGGYEFPFALSASFNVTSGPNTFYMTGVTDGNAFVTLPNITAIFVPEKL